MNTGTKLMSLLLVLVAGVSHAAESSSSQSGKTLDKSPVVGKYVQVGGNKVLSCDQKLLTDTIRLPLSFFTEEMEIIKLDDRDEALVKESRLTVSDNYILAHGKPFKLFDRKGKFLTNVGGIGQGPGEYTNVYDAQIDEPNNRIYLMPWSSKNILVYDLKGKTLDPIPLPFPCPKSKFRIDTQKGIASIVVLPFPGNSTAAWTQDLKGNQLNNIRTGHLGLPRDFSNEVESSFNMPGIFDVNISQIMPTARIDSLYRYDAAKGQLNPTFTLKFKNADKIPWHGYYEWPDHYTGNISTPVEVAPGQWTSSGTEHFIVDKKTGKGSYFKLDNDFFGNLEIGWPSITFSNGYYSRNIEPGNLLNEIEKALKNKGLSDSMRKKLTNLQNSINDNDNNYVMIAKLRK